PLREAVGHEVADVVAAALHVVVGAEPALGTGLDAVGVAAAARGLPGQHGLGAGGAALGVERPGDVVDFARAGLGHGAAHFARLHVLHQHHGAVGDFAGQEHALVLGEVGAGRVGQHAGVAGEVLPLQRGRTRAAVARGVEQAFG